MQVGGVSLDLTLIMHEQAFGDYLTDHSFLYLESVGWRTGYGLSFVRFLDSLTMGKDLLYAFVKL